MFCVRYSIYTMVLCLYNFGFHMVISMGEKRRKEAVCRLMKPICNIWNKNLVILNRSNVNEFFFFSFLFIFIIIIIVYYRFLFELSDRYFPFVWRKLMSIFTTCFSLWEKKWESEKKISNSSSKLSLTTDTYIRLSQTHYKVKRGKKKEKFFSQTQKVCLNCNAWSSRNQCNEPTNKWKFI